MADPIQFDPQTGERITTVHGNTKSAFQFDPETGERVAATAQGSQPYNPGTTAISPTAKQVGTGVLREGANLASGAHNIGRKGLELLPGATGCACQTRQYGRGLRAIRRGDGFLPDSR
jgi:hypothetical protein